MIQEVTASNLVILARPVVKKLSNINVFFRGVIRNVVKSISKILLVGGFVRACSHTGRPIKEYIIINKSQDFVQEVCLQMGELYPLVKTIWNMDFYKNSFFIESEIIVF